MARDYQEREFDDEVYEDGFYNKSEELRDEDRDSESSHDESDGHSEEEVKVHVSFACEDCDYRWDDIIVKIKGNLEDEEHEHEGVCAMCGSMNITQI